MESALRLSAAWTVILFEEWADLPSQLCSASSKEAFCVDFALLWTDAISDVLRSLYEECLLSKLLIV